MATVSASLRMFDMMTRPLQQVTQALNLTISSMEQLNNAGNRDISITNSLNAAREASIRAGAGLNELITEQDRARNSQNNLNNSFRSSGSSIDGLSGKVRNLVGAYIGLRTVGSVIKISDEFVQTTARLNMMNDKLQTTGELQNMIFQSAQRSRASYSDTAKAVSQLGIRAKDAFSGNAEVVAFSETLNKMFTIAGAGQQEMSSATLQLTQALGSGVLRGEEFNAVFEAAPNVMQAVANYINKPIGQLRNMASEGKISADIVKQALFAAANETNIEFEKMPKTIGQIWSSIKNQGLRAFEPVLLKINKIANNPNFGVMVTNISNGMATIANVTLGIIDTISNVGAFFQSNWGIISPIIWGIVAALLVYNATMGFAWLTTVTTTAAKVAHTIASWAETAAIIAMTFAQQGLNAALALCPITWIIIAIIILIAIFYAAVAAVNHFAGTSYSATGMICGAFAVAGAFIGNIIIALVNGVIDSFAIVWNFIATFAEFFANVFNDPIGSIIRLFSGLADTVLQILAGIASAIDTLFGSNLASAVNGWQGSLQGLTDEVAGEAKIKVERIDPSSMHLDRLNYSNAWDGGNSVGKSIESKAGNLFNGLGANDLGAGASGLGSDLGKNADAGAKSLKNIDDKIDVSNEHLEMLRDLAEEKSIQNFVTLTPTVQVTTGDVKQEADIDKIISKIETYMENELQNSAEGLYE